MIQPGIRSDKSGYVSSVLQTAEEVYFLEYEDEPTDTECRDEAEKIIQNVLDEYIRQHFEESTKAAVKFAVNRQPKYRLT